LRYPSSPLLDHFCYPAIDDMVGGDSTVTAEAIGAMESYFYSLFGSETLTNTAEDL